MRRHALMLLVLVGLMVAACAAPAPAAPAAPAAQATTPPAEAPAAEAAAMVDSELPEVNPLEVTGDIITAGSSTVFPLTEAVAARFRDEGYAGNITIDSIGTGAGFERFCKAGESDISNASRAIRDSEVENCRAIGREPIEFRIGTDALAVVVNPNNDWLDAGVTLEQLAVIFSDEATNWSDVDPSWPDTPILRFIPGTDSGTFDYFVEAVMTPAYKELAEERHLSAANLQLSEDDNVLVQGVEGDVNAIGYFGYAYYQENADRLDILTLNDVEATTDNVDAGLYPLARPIFIYSDAQIMQDKPQVAAFINFYLTYVNEEIRGVGYFPAPAAALDEAKANWVAALGE
ncbi:MAG: PstS family phosphate ABC transporter substrate-binding protein [Caldilineaceae bacterium]|nr:PstS family phosphate ABC transporter substrate-binding protein [Caldilineaceae bacterium]